MFKPENYPTYWKQFSEYIRFERANNKCEQCGADNYKSHPETGSKVVLTVAHLDNENGICNCKEIYGFKCAKPLHCLALCQSCHLNLDRFSNLATRRENLANKKDLERVKRNVLIEQVFR